MDSGECPGVSRMDVGQEHGPDLASQLLGVLEVMLEVALRVDHGSAAPCLIGDGVILKQISLPAARPPLSRDMELRDRDDLLYAPGCPGSVETHRPAHSLSPV